MLIVQDGHWTVTLLTQLVLSLYAFVIPYIIRPHLCLPYFLIKSLRTSDSDFF